MPNWKAPESTERLLAAVIASAGKIDCRKIATYYGQGATYDSIEGRLRALKKQATTLREEVDSGARPAAPPRGGFKASVSETDNPKKERKTTKKGVVLNGRVSKTSTPTKNKGAGVKEKMSSNAAADTGVKIENCHGGGADEVDETENGVGAWQEGNAGSFETLAFGGYEDAGYAGGFVDDVGGFEGGMEV